jgi:Zn-finger nucleic acid-binding protein
MNCPECEVSLQQTDCHGVKVEECPKCLGRWFDRDELRQAKDRTDEDLRWLDFDPFARDAEDLPTADKGCLCPRCSVKMGVIAYEKSGVRIEKCWLCQGVWLNHGEFEKIVKHLEKEVNGETAAQYGAEAAKQFAEVFTGPEGPISEARDLFAVLHLLRMRFSVEHPSLSSTIDTIYAANPFK